MTRRITFLGAVLIVCAGLLGTGSVHAQTAPTSSASVTVDINPLPTVSLSVADSAVNYGAASTLSWSSTNSSSCTVTVNPVPAGWTDLTGTSNSGVTTQALAKNTTFTISCADAYGQSATDSKTVAVHPLPTASLSTAASAVNYATATTLSWTSANASSCKVTASPVPTGWADLTGTSNQGVTSQTLTQDTTFTLACSDAYGQSASDSKKVTAHPQLSADLSLSLSDIGENIPDLISWSSKNVSACTVTANPAPANWKDLTALSSGTVTTAPLAQTTVFTLSCSDQYGQTVSDHKTATVHTKPTASLSVALAGSTSQGVGAAGASSISINKNSAVTVSWSSTNASQCVATSFPNYMSDQFKVTGTSGSVTINQVPTSGTFSVTCSDNYGQSATGSEDVAVRALPTASLTTADSSVNQGSATTLSWTSLNTASCTVSAAPAPTGWTNLTGTTNTGVTSKNLSADTAFTLSCSDGYGQSASDAKSVTVNHAPVLRALIIPSTDDKKANHPQNFSIAADDSDNDQIKYEIDWDNNGTIDETQPASGLVNSGTSVTLTHTWTTAGAQNFSVRATDAKGFSSAWRKLPVTIAANVSPIASVTAPARNAVLTTGVSATVSATASDSDGTISKVDFYVDDTLLATDIASPYSAAWFPTAPGAHVIKAVATDNDGATTPSSVSVTVVNQNHAPSAPAIVGADGYEGQSLSFSFSTVDQDGDNVTYDINWGDGTADTKTDLVSSSQPLQLSHSWTGAGPKTIQAIVTDENGLSSPPTNKPININSVIGPAASINANPTNVPYPGGNVVISWSSDDSDSCHLMGGDIDELVAPNTSDTRTVSVTAGTTFSISCNGEWYWSLIGGAPAVSQVTVSILPRPNNAPFGPDIVAASTNDSLISDPQKFSLTADDQDGDLIRYEIDWNGDGAADESLPVSGYVDHNTTLSTTHVWTSKGLYTPSARTIDSRGLASKWVPFTVNIGALNHPPQVSITSPVDGSSAVTQGSVAISADATDDDGSIAKVEFFIDNSTVPFAVVMDAPYTATWNAVTGTHTIRAKATDNDQATNATSIGITVTPLPIPTGTIEVKRVGSDGSQASAPDASSQIAGVAPWTTDNPAEFQSLDVTADGYEVDSSNVAHYDVTVGTCTFASGGPECVVPDASFNISPTCVDSVCSVSGVDVSKDVTTKVVYKYTPVPVQPLVCEGDEPPDNVYINKGDSTYVAGYTPTSWTYGLVDGGSNACRFVCVNNGVQNGNACDAPAPVPPTDPTIDGVGGVEGIQLPFTFTSTDKQGSRVKYEIDWGDDSAHETTDLQAESTGVIVSHSWVGDGTKTIKAMAIDENGLTSGWTSQDITIDAATGPAASLNGNPSELPYGGGTSVISWSSNDTSGDPTSCHVSGGSLNEDVPGDASDTRTVTVSQTTGFSISCIGAWYWTLVGGAPAMEYATVTVDAANAPGAPVVSADSENNNLVFVPQIFHMSSTGDAADLLKYEIDWNNDGVIDETIPSASASAPVTARASMPRALGGSNNVAGVGLALAGSRTNTLALAGDALGAATGDLNTILGFVAPGVPQVTTHVWNDAGPKMFQVSAEDVSGLVSPWTKFVASIGHAPVPFCTANPLDPTCFHPASGGTVPVVPVVPPPVTPYVPPAVGFSLTSTPHTSPLQIIADLPAKSVPINISVGPVNFSGPVTLSATAATSSIALMPQCGATPPAPGQVCVTFAFTPSNVSQSTSGGYTPVTLRVGFSGSVSKLKQDKVGVIISGKSGGYSAETGTVIDPNAVNPSYQEQ